MRIAVVTPEYPPDTIGGGGIVVESIARELLKRHEVRVFSAWDGRRSWIADRLQDFHDGVPVNRYPLVPLGRRKHYLRSVVPPNPRAIARLWSDLSAWDPDVAHLHGYGYAIVDLAAFALRRKSVPYIFTVHGVPVTPFEKGGLSRLSYLGYRRFGVGLTQTHARAVTAISESVARSLPAVGRVEVIPNGLSPLPDSSEGRARRLRSELNIEDGVPIIAAAGRLTRSKGFDVLLKSLKYLDLPCAACVLAGADGGMLAELEQLQADLPTGVTASCIGRVDRQGIADLFQLASVIAVPSRDEPFGLVALEALAAGRRVVASNVGGLKEFLLPQVAELVPPGDPVALGTALKTAIRRGALGPEEAAAAGRVLDRHSWTQLALRYEKLLKAGKPNDQDHGRKRESEMMTGAGCD